MKRLTYALALGGFIAGAVPVQAKVVEASERGFVVRHQAEVPSEPGAAWDMLINISQWWDSQHSWSGSAANMSIDPRAGGCFCEVLPDRDAPKAPSRGGVEHMRVIFADRPQTLRMIGVLGPLQADAATGTMTIQLKPAAKGKGTQILLEYVVGGYVRTPYEQLAPAVDGVLGDQLRRLAAKLGGAAVAVVGEQGRP